MVNNLHSAHPTGAEYLKAVLSSKVYDVAQVTPLQDMAKLSERLGNKVFIKREDRQPVHSFKLRGAYAMIAGLSAEQKASGVIAASAKPCTRRGAVCQTSWLACLNRDATKHPKYQSRCRAWIWW